MSGATNGTGRALFLIRSDNTHVDQARLRPTWGEWSMVRKLKVYVTSLGFFEQAIAAPSMKAALEAWGADSNLFHQGAAKETTDPDIVTATTKKPGVVLKRAVGSDGPFGESPNCPRASVATRGRNA